MNDSIDPGLCPLCGEPNGCHLASAEPYQGPCWCLQVETNEQALQRVLPECRRCLCRSCLEKKPACNPEHALMRCRDKAITSPSSR